MKVFLPLFGISQVIGIVSVILVGVWCGVYRGGFAWTEKPGLQFNWHPLLMTLGMIFLYGNGILAYRVLQNQAKKQVKIIHGVVMISVFIIDVIGLQAVFDFHNLKNIPNMYSLHSWLGVSAVALFLLQWIIGLVTFLFPGLPDDIRKKILPIHVIAGISIFVLSWATAIAGVTEKAFFVMKDDKSTPDVNEAYSGLPAEAILVNWMGVFISAYVISVLALATHGGFKKTETKQYMANKKEDIEIENHGSENQ